MLPLAASCGAKTVSPYAPDQIAQAVIATLKGAPILHPLLPGDDYYDTYLKDIYEIAEDAPDDGVIYYAGGIEACEIAVFRHANAEAAKKTEALLLAYKERRMAVFTGYAPEQAALVEQGAAVSRGTYAALFLCESPENAKAVFMSCFSGNPPKLPETTSTILTEPASEASAEPITFSMANAEASTTATASANAAAATTEATAEAVTKVTETAAAIATTAPVTTEAAVTVEAVVIAESATAGIVIKAIEGVTVSAESTPASAAAISGTAASTTASAAAAAASTTASAAVAAADTATAAAAAAADTASAAAAAADTATTTAAADGISAGAMPARTADAAAASSTTAATTDNAATSTTTGATAADPTTDATTGATAAVPTTAATADSAATTTTSTSTTSTTAAGDAHTTIMPSGESENAQAGGNGDGGDNNNAYDHAAVLTAWKKGDASALANKNALIYEACKYVIDEAIAANMSEYDKELAIHDWIVKWADYDKEAASNAPDAKPDPDNDNPYGLFYSKKAICKGYTLTFQLFMDMLGIECITVDGTSKSGAEPHAWNMVRLDGEWYCVDVTWDDPVSSGKVDLYLYHRFFNVTSEYLKELDHQWDENKAPEATAETYRWNYMAANPGV